MFKLKIENLDVYISPFVRCFEASWEVTNKQGGIYTVLRSKAAVSTQELGDRYIMLGPLTQAHQHEVELCPPVTGSPLDKSLQVRSSRNDNYKGNTILML